jgi:DNA-binding transcriptional ArsR family regulator
MNQVETSSTNTIFEITTPKQQKAYLHPLRMKILGYLVKEKLTVSQTAERLKVHPANITHHFKILLNNKLIQLAEERDIGRVIEKYYVAVAQVYNIRPPGGSENNVNARVLSFLRNDLSATINLLSSEDHESLLGLMMRARIDKTQFDQFCCQLEKLISQFQKADQADGETYALNVSLYPHKIDYGPIGRYELKKKN